MDEDKNAIYPFNTRAEFDAYLKMLAEKAAQPNAENGGEAQSSDLEARRDPQITDDYYLSILLKGPGF